MRNVSPHSVSKMNPGPKSTRSLSPKMTLVWRVFTFCTMVVTSGTRRTSSRQKAFDAGNSSPLVTTVTSTSPLLWPTRTTAWRTKPAPVSSL